jgi:membrane protein
MPFMALTRIPRLLKTAFDCWLDAKAPRLGAALAFYAVVSLAPLLVFALFAAALVYGPDAATGKLASELEGTLGRAMADALQEMIRNSHQPGQGLAQTILGVAMVLFGASGVFVGLQDAMNTIWQVAPRPGRALLGMIRDRALSFTMVIGVCFVLLVSLVLTSVLAILVELYPSYLPGGAFLWQGLNYAVSFIVVTVLFALILKVLPDAVIRWPDVWIGAVTTALLFTLGKYVLGIYFTHASVATGYGAAGSLLIALLWVYYVAQVFLFGAAFTRTYALQFGSGVRPTANAVVLSPADRAREGIATGADIEGAAASKVADERGL